jgi:hypothetical protein
MDALLRKLRATYANAQDALGEWAAAQSTLCALCAASCSVVTRLRLLADDAHFGALKLDGTVPELCRRTQLEALDALLQSAHEQVRRRHSRDPHARAAADRTADRGAQLRTLRAVVQRLEKLAADGNALLQVRAVRAERSVLLAPARLSCALACQGLRPPPAQGGGVRHGPQPSLAECVEVRAGKLSDHVSGNALTTPLAASQGLDDLWRVHRDELALKACGARGLRHSAAASWAELRCGRHQEALLLGVTLDASERDLQGVQVRPLLAGSDCAGQAPHQPSFVPQALLNAEPNVQSQRRDALLLRACA